MSATSAIAATAQGSAEPNPRSPLSVLLPGTVLPTGVPQRWQNFAPGVSAAAQLAQEVAVSAAPHVEQNLPDAVALHEGQLCAGVEAGEGDGAGEGEGEDAWAGMPEN